MLRSTQVPCGPEHSEQLIVRGRCARVEAECRPRSVDAPEQPESQGLERLSADACGRAEHREAHLVRDGRERCGEHAAADLHHAQVALHGGDVGPVPASDLEVGRPERLQRSLDDAVLTERRQHAARVVGERP